MSGHMVLPHGSTSLWNSPWCPAWKHIYDDLVIQTSGFTYPATPKDLWISSQKVWNDTLFLPRTALIIKNTTILPSDCTDTLCWKLTPNGKCNTKSAYKACLQVLHEAGEPAPAPVCNEVKTILKQVWKTQDMIPRVKTFISRILTKAIPMGDRASRYSKHIEKLCCRCGLPESDVHLFFLCPKAAWFLSPWFLQSESLLATSNSIAQVISLLTMNHPESNLNFIVTFLWCLWKARNDSLFGRKNSNPEQIAMRAKALLQDLEASSMIPPPQVSCRPTDPSCARSRDTVSDYLHVAGPKLYVDAAWKTRPNQNMAKAGLGVYLVFQDQGYTSDVLISVSLPAVSSPIQAEAQALLLVGNISSSLNLRDTVFFTDCSNLAKMAAAPGTSDQMMLWEIKTDN
jgi:hypothetical protein